MIELTEITNYCLRRQYEANSNGIEFDAISEYQAAYHSMPSNKWRIGKDAQYELYQDTKVLKAMLAVSDALDKMIWQGGNENE